METYTVTYEDGQTSGYGDGLAEKGHNDDEGLEGLIDDNDQNDQGEESKEKVASSERGNPEPWEKHRYDKFDYNGDNDPDPAKDPVTQPYVPVAPVVPPPPPDHRPPTPTKVGRR
jgi:hypothetical protein